MVEKGIRHRPKQSLGQNFLVDGNIARKIVSAINPLKDDVVLEIGAGHGAITGLIAGSGCTLVVVEIDRRMTGGLRESLSNENVEIVEGDFLNVSLAALSRRFGKKIRIVGNIPYHLTSPILFKVFGEYASVSDCTVMLQREVARRIVAPPGSRTYGILSVMTGLHGRGEILFDVSPNCFFPKPKVTSSVLRVTMCAKLPDGLDAELFRNVVRTAFGKRRKTLRNSLQYLGDKFHFAPAGAVGCPVPLDLRPEALSVDDFILLTHYIDAER